MSPVLLICTLMSSKTLCKTILFRSWIKIFIYPTSLILLSPCPSSEIEPSADDIHAELVEDEDEEVRLQTVVSGKRKPHTMRFRLCYLFLLLVKKQIHLGSRILFNFLWVILSSNAVKAKNNKISRNTCRLGGYYGARWVIRSANSLWRHGGYRMWDEARLPMVTQIIMMTGVWHRINKTDAGQTHLFLLCDVNNQQICCINPRTSGRLSGWTASV